MHALHLAALLARRQSAAPLALINRALKTARLRSPLCAVRVLHPSGALWALFVCGFPLDWSGDWSLSLDRNNVPH